MPQLKTWYTPQDFSGVPDLMRGYGYRKVETLEEASILVLTGGSDISPRLYGQDYHRSTHDWKERDEREVIAFERAKERGIPMFGICRGAQLICALNGGQLWQDVSGHSRSHMCHDQDGQEMFMVSSLHHQMCRPSKDVDILGYANGITSRLEDDREQLVGPFDFGEEPELMYHKNINALAVQGHPEFMSDSSGFVRWCGNFIHRHLEG